jgi:hypothetical protein
MCNFRTFGGKNNKLSGALGALIGVQIGPTIYQKLPWTKMSIPIELEIQYVSWQGFYKHFSGRTENREFSAKLTLKINSAVIMAIFEGSSWVPNGVQIGPTIYQKLPWTKMSIPIELEIQYVSWQGFYKHFSGRTENREFRAKLTLKINSAVIMAIFEGSSRVPNGVQIGPTGVQKKLLSFSYPPLCSILLSELR